MPGPPDSAAVDRHFQAANRPRQRSAPDRHRRRSERPEPFSRLGVPLHQPPDSGNLNPPFNPRRLKSEYRRIRRNRLAVPPPRSGSLLRRGCAANQGSHRGGCSNSLSTATQQLLGFPFSKKLRAKRRIRSLGWNRMGSSAHRLSSKAARLWISPGRRLNNCRAHLVSELKKTVLTVGCPS